MGISAWMHDRDSGSEYIPLKPLHAFKRQNSQLVARLPSNSAMKFSSSLKFNAVSEWWDEYIAYDVLKRRIYQLEKRQFGRELDLEANERASLLHDGEPTDTDAIFIPLLDRELKKITTFYESQQRELLDDLAKLEVKIREHEEAGLAAAAEYYDDYLEEEDDEDEDDEENAASPTRERGSRLPPQRSRKSSSVGYHRRAGSNARQEESPVRHRHSISSSDEGGDLEASYSSLRPSKLSSGTIGKARRLASKVMGGLRDSVASSGNQEMSVWTAKMGYAWDMRLLFKRQITNLYVSVSSLQSYVETNYLGFRKILKKYDKVTESELKDRYLHDIVEPALPFTQTSKTKLSDALSRLLSLYATCVTRGDVAAAKQQLKLHQRENIAWERDTVWRLMIGQTRRGEGGADSSSDTRGATLALKSDEDVGILFKVRTPVGPFKLTTTKMAALFAVVVFISLLNVQIVEGAEANRCLAILVFSTILWATEAIPLFVTSTMVPLLLVLCEVIRSPTDGARLSPPDATKFVFSTMFSPTVMLLIGGFTISSALSKTNIDRVLITRVLSLAGTKPNTVLLAFMCVSCFASMWISNVAAPTLCFTLVRPILRTLPPKASFGPCLIIAIALAANIGGQSSPISSPQNLIALQAMDPPIDWSTWFAVALPVSFISLILIWLLLIVSYQPSRAPGAELNTDGGLMSRAEGEGELEVKAIRPTKERFGWKQWWVTGVCLVTIGLWCTEHLLHDIVGDMGVIAILPIVAFFSTGVLKKDDFEQFMWTIVFMAMGGIALGKGVMSSGLLDVLDTLIRELMEGLSLYTVVLVLSVVVLVISTFISHTIASILLVPIAKEVGSNLSMKFGASGSAGSGTHVNLLIFITGLICSAGMGMPVSGFPNQTAATQEDELGQRYLSNVDFLKNGIPASIISTLVVATVGFLLMKVVGL